MRDEFGVPENINMFNRQELVEYLESRGFCVSDSETVDDIREAARLQMKQEENENV